MIRTHEAGTLRAQDIGQTVTLAGWIGRRRDHGGVAFLDLRDGSGIVQVVVHDPEVAHPLRNEFCVKVVGEVVARPEGNENQDLDTGAVEVMVESLEVLSEAAPLPFPIDEHVEVGEEARLRYRYLDLRRPEPARIMRLRSKVNQIAREVLFARDFLEIETPTLTRSTPEGARDFLVPVRLQPGNWYALPQSPQLFKQLLMVAGMERYFQIARCYRDEDFRKDRQPEFTQLDIEMSFVEQSDVLAVGEDVIRALWAGTVGHEIGEIPHMTFAEAMRRFGSDKPDLRFDVELVELTEYFAQTPFRVFQAPYVGAVVMPGGGSQPRRTFDAWQEWAKQRGARGLAYVTLAEDGTLGGPVAKNITEAERDGLAAATGAKPGDCIFFAAGPANEARALLGAARAGDRRALRPDRPRRMVVPLDRRCTGVRGGRRPTTALRAGPPCTTPSPHPTPSGSTASRSRPGRPWPTPTTWSATATRSAADPSVSTVPTSRAGSSPCSASMSRRPRTSSASCWTPSPSDRPRTAASPSAGTGSSCCSPAPRRCAT